MIEPQRLVSDVMDAYCMDDCAYCRLTVGRAGKDVWLVACDRIIYARWGMNVACTVHGATMHVVACTASLWLAQPLCGCATDDDDDPSSEEEMIEWLTTRCIIIHM